jgi:hypothetical protein
VLFPEAAGEKTDTIVAIVSRDAGKELADEMLTALVRKPRRNGMEDLRRAGP